MVTDYVTFSVGLNLSLARHVQQSIFCSRSVAQETVVMLPADGVCQIICIHTQI